MSGVAAILLAAGSARRFAGGGKLLAEIDGVPILARAARAIAGSRCSSLIVVTGPSQERVKGVLAAIAGLTPRFVHNPDHETGIGSSIAAGVHATPADSRAIVVVQGDMPGLTSALIDALIDRLDEAERAGVDLPIVHPVLADGRQRSPVLWPARFRAELEALSGDHGAKGLIAAHRSETAPVRIDDAALLADIDTVEELEAYRARRL